MSAQSETWKKFNKQRAKKAKQEKLVLKGKVDRSTHPLCRATL